MSRIVSIGECMVELSRGAEGQFGLAYGGDTFNTAVYLARAGCAVSYATRLGDDPYSVAIAELARAEGVQTSLIGTSAGRNAGLYLIETTAEGERSFHYWRDRAPARELFDGPDGARVVAAMAAARLIYFSGITLSLYTDGALDRFALAIETARAGGTRVVMDGNYRPRGWKAATPDGQARARNVFERFWRLADVALPTFDDEVMLWGEHSRDTAIARLRSFGVQEIVLKRGAEGAVVSVDGAVRDVPCPAVVTAIDTTAAGDSFNAGYLAARLAGAASDDAAVAGHRLAGVVIQHRGAIVPRAATAGMWPTV